MLIGFILLVKVELLFTFLFFICALLYREYFNLSVILNIFVNIFFLVDLFNPITTYSFSFCLSIVKSDICESFILSLFFNFYCLSNNMHLILY